MISACRIAVLSISVGLAMSAASALADALPHEQTYSLGRPPRPVAVRVDPGAEPTLTVGGKKRKLRAQGVTEVRAEIVKPGGDSAALVLRLRGGEGEWMALVGGRSGSELLRFERTDPTGDPGERQAHVLAVQGESVELGLRRDGVSLCGERPYLFGSSRLDASTLMLVSQTAPHAFTATQKLDAVVTPAAAPNGSPRYRGLVATASSDIDPLTDLPRAPVALLDGDLQRGVKLPAGGVVVFRWESPLVAIEQLEVAIGASPKGGELVWFDDSAEAVRATLPSAAGRSSYRIAPPTPRSTRCLAIGNAGSSALELLELAASTALDRGPEEITRLIGLLVQDDPRAPEAADVLASLGAEAAESLAARWEELPALGKRRSLKVLAPALAREPVRARVVELARAGDVEARKAALNVLDRGGEPGRVGLRELARAADATRNEAADEAALRLAADPDEIPALLSAMGSPGGAARPALRRALALAAKRDEAKFRAALASWRETGPSVAAVASVSLALASDHGEVVRDLAAALAPKAESFEDRHRFAVALARAEQAGFSTEVEQWLLAQTKAEEWMQRRAALDALAAIHSASVGAVARELARDPYPRVRAAAAAPLLAIGERAEAERMLREDGWPLVRVEAVRALARGSEANAAIASAVDDRSPRVRRAAIEALTAVGDRRAAASVTARLERSDEALAVRHAAIQYLRTLCLAEGREALLRMAGALRTATPSEQATELALEALRALHDLGGAAAEAGAQLVHQASTPELETMWRALPSPSCAGRPEA